MDSSAKSMRSVNGDSHGSPAERRDRAHSGEAHQFGVLTVGAFDLSGPTAVEDSLSITDMELPAP